MEIRFYRAPGWIIPFLILLALALLPFAMVLALAVAGAALGAAVLRFLFLPAQEQTAEKNKNILSEGEGSASNTPVIDADFEVKDENEKK